jgi:hypothetical protein
MFLRTLLLLAPLWLITSARAELIVTAPGTYQTSAGCASNWDPACLASELSDLGGGQYSLTVNTIPTGNYAFKIALDLSWTTNYGQGGALGGSNVPFFVPTDFTPVTFTWDSGTHVPDVIVGATATPEPSAFVLVGAVLAFASARRFARHQ